MRGTVEVRLQTDADAVVEQLRSRYGDPVKLTNSLDPSQPAPLPNGYRGINSVWMIDGEPVEAQVTVPEMLAAKEKAHSLYAEWQRIERAALDEGRDNTADELARMAELDAAQAAIYQPAWEAAMRRMNSSREKRWCAGSRAGRVPRAVIDGNARTHGCGAGQDGARAGSD